MPGGGKGKGGISGTLNVNDTANANVTLDIVGLDDIGVSAELAVPKPIEMKNTVVADAKMRNELAVTQPIVTDVNASARHRPQARGRLPDPRNRQAASEEGSAVPSSVTSA
jgi:hypothetical protein